MAGVLRASAGDTSGMRESYGAYLARTTVVDPEKEEEDQRRREEAAILHAAKMARRRQLHGAGGRTASASHQPRAAGTMAASPVGRGRRRTASAGGAAVAVPVVDAFEEHMSVPPFMERTIEKGMAADVSRRRALLPLAIQPSLPSFATHGGAARPVSGWEGAASRSGLLPAMSPVALGGGGAVTSTDGALPRAGDATAGSGLWSESKGADATRPARPVATPLRRGGALALAPAPRAADELGRISRSAGGHRLPELPVGARMGLSPPPAARVGSRPGDGTLSAASLARLAKVEASPAGRLRPGASGSAAASAAASSGAPETTAGQTAAEAGPAKPRRKAKPPRAVAFRAEPDPLPRLVGDKSMPDAPLDELRARRWRELRFLHALMVRHGRTLEDLIGVFGTRDTIRRSHFTVIMTGFLGLDGWAMDPHFVALFDGFDLSNKASVDPREIACSLSLLDKPAEEVVAAVCSGFSFFASRPASGGGEATISRERALSLMFRACATQAEEDGLRANMVQVIEAFERFDGDPLPARVTSKQLRRAIYYAPRFQDEFRRVWMRRLPDNVRMLILRRAAERASLQVQAHELALGEHKARVFMRDRIRPRILKAFVAEWAAFTKEATHLRGLETRADDHFRRRKSKAAIKFWLRRAQLPRKRVIANSLGRKQMLTRCFARLKLRWIPYSILRRRATRKEREEILRVHALAMQWRARREKKQQRDLMRAGFWAISQEHARRMRYRRAQEFRRKRLLLNQFSAWKANSVEVAASRRLQEQRRREMEAAARARVDELLEAQRAAEAEAAAAVEREAAEQRAYSQLLRAQRRRAAIIAAFNEATKSMAMRRAFRRRKAFNKLERRGLKLWDAEKPAKLEAKRQELWTWAHETDEGKAEIGDLVTYALASLEPTSVPAHLRGGTDAAGVSDTPRELGGGAAVPKAAAALGPSCESLHVRPETLGTREREPWQLGYKYQELVRQWTNVKTGETIGPARNKAGLPPMTAALAQRVAVENFLAIREPYLEKTVDLDFGAFAAAASKHGHAYIIQDFFRTCMRVARWKSIKDLAVKARKRDMAVSNARIRKAAILTLQCAWRCRMARQQVLWRLLGVWAMCVDLSSMAPYYTNSATGESRWEPPALLCHLAQWNWHADRERRLALMSDEQREEYWEGSAHGGENERKARAVLHDYALGLAQRRLRRALVAMSNPGGAALEPDEEPDPLEGLGIKPRAGAPPVPMLRYEAEVSAGGAYYRSETGEVTTGHPDGHIVCEECSHRFAAAYVAEEDRLLCGECFVAKHNKLKRADVAAFVVAPGPYRSPFQAPQHVNRSPQQLFGERFARPVAALEYRRAHPKAKTYLLLG